MKHKRGIDFAAHSKPSNYHVFDSEHYTTLRDLMSWDVLGSQCSECDHIGWVDKDAILRIHGNQYLRTLRQKFRCVCGNATNNKVLIGKLPR